MARKPSPWYWPERHGWYTILHGQRQKLLDLSAEVPPPKKRNGKWVAPADVEQAFHKLLAVPPQQDFPKTSPTAAGPLVVEILDKYLSWCKREKAPRTYDWYRDHIQHFLDSLPGAASLAVSDLKPFHVVDWVGTQSSWSATYRRGAIMAVQRPFNWAEELGYIPANPIKKIKKPAPERRDNPVTPGDFEQLLSKVREGDPFRDLLLFAWHTGCRPQEARHIEPRHVNLAAECVVIPKEEAKGKKRTRVILLQGPALDIVKRLMESRSAGKLFLNADGGPWKKFAICNRFDRLMLSFGMDALKADGIPIPPLPRFNRRAYANKDALAAARKEQQKKLRDRRKQIIRLARQHGKGFAAYDLRHGFCQRLLENGANHLAVAELMGHSNGNMVSQTYSHMNRADAHLKDTLRKASGEDAQA